MIETESVEPRRRWLALGVLAAALSMIVVDGTVVGVALPVLVTDLGLSLSGAQWVTGIYAVVVAALLTTAGSLGDSYGWRRLLLAGIAVFLGGSLLAALAGSGAALIGARAIQGVGAAAVLPATLSTVNATFRGRDRVVAFAVWGSVISGMAALGPLLGGVLTESAGWRWIFLVNVPFGALVVVGVLAAVPAGRAVTAAPGIDGAGAVLSAAGVGSLVFALVQGPVYGWWTPLGPVGSGRLSWPASAPVSPVPVAFAAGAIALAAFVVHQRHRAAHGRPVLLDIGLFAIGSFRRGSVAALVISIGEFALLFVLPLFLVGVRGSSTVDAGLLLSAMGGGAFLSGAGARHLAARIGPRGTVLIGLGAEALAVAVLAATLGPHSPGWALALPLAGYGAGLGLASAQLTSIVLADVPVSASGQASATQSTVRQLGSALGATTAGTVLSLALTGTVHSALEATGTTGPRADSLVEATRDTAGAVVTAGRGARLPDAVLDALATGFTDAARIVLACAAALFVVGIVVAARIGPAVDRAVRPKIPAR